ncbi:MAG TPA: hypothetical protein VGB53_08165 [Rubricoccaceae bacterium]|jgi:hypothetical protein
MRILSLALVGLTLLGGCSSGRDVYNRADRYDRTSRSYPASARTTQGGQARYAVCHNGRNSMTLPEAAVDAHIRHGDRFGACSTQARGRDDRGRDDRGRADQNRDDRGSEARGRGNGRGNGRGRN